MFQKLSAKKVREIHLQIGRNVKYCRMNKGYSQLDLSIELGYKSTSPIAMAEIYYKGTHFNIENLANVSKCLDVDIDKLFDGVNSIINK